MNNLLRAEANFLDPDYKRAWEVEADFLEDYFTDWVDLEDDLEVEDYG